jgi:hypothetical protein
MKWDGGRRTHSPKSNRQASFHLLLRISHGGDANAEIIAIFTPTPGT